jgi:altronate dehydratase
MRVGLKEVQTPLCPRIPFVRLNAHDNVCVALKEIPEGTSVEIDGVEIFTRQMIPFGHKFAVADVPMGGHVIKYGEIIGLVTQPILVGDHVHLHNLQSLRDKG